MGNIFPLKSKNWIKLIAITALLALAACAAPAQKVTPTEIPPIVPSVMPAQVEPPTPATGSDGEQVFLDNVIYPGAEFLFEVPGFGGPMVPWRYYVVRNVTPDQLIDHYSKLIPSFKVEFDAMENGFRNVTLVHPNPMGFLSNVQDVTQLAEISAAFDGAVLGIEISRSGAHDHLNRVGIATREMGLGDKIPKDSTILVIDYFSNPY